MKKLAIFALAMVALMICISVTYADMDDAPAISISLVNQEPDPAVAGDTVEVRLGIENIGGSATNNLVVELEPEYPFELVSGQNAAQNVGTIESYQNEQNMKIVKYTLRVNRDANAASYELKVNYYEEGLTTKAQKSLSIDVKNRESAEVIHIDKTTIVPGKQTSLKFIINNVGNAPLRDLTFYWENEDKIILPVGSDNTRYIKYIDMGGSAEIEYQVIADTNAAAGLYKLNLYLTYEKSINTSGNKISTIAGVYVGGGTDFDVAFSESANSQTSFSIANVGSNPASSVSVIIPEQRAWRVTGTNSVIIGNLNKGDYTVASFKLQQSGGINPQNRSTRGTAPQGVVQRQGNVSSDKLIMQIDYTDTMGERKSVQKEVKMNPQNMMTDAQTAGAQTAFQGRMAAQNESFLSKYKWYIVGLALLVIGYFAYRRHKNRKLQNTKFNIDIFKGKKK